MSKVTPIRPITNELRFDGDELTNDQIPNPTGYRIVLAPVSIEQKAGSIILTSDTQKAAETVRFVAKVRKMGPLCYRQDRHKAHPKAIAVPWCKVGDVVSVGIPWPATPVL